MGEGPNNLSGMPRELVGERKTFREQWQARYACESGNRVKQSLLEQAASRPSLFSLERTSTPCASLRTAKGEKQYREEPQSLISV